MNENNFKDEKKPNLQEGSGYQIPITPQPNRIEKLVLSLDKYIDIKFESKIKLIGRVFAILTIILLLWKYLSGTISAELFRIYISFIPLLAVGFARFSRLVRPSNDKLRIMGLKIYNTTLPPYGTSKWLKIRIREHYYSFFHVILSEFFWVWIIAIVIGVIFIFILKYFIN